MRPAWGGSGNFTRVTIWPRLSPEPSAPASMRAMRFSMLWAMVALVALAPKRSTMVWRRSTSLDRATASLASRTSSASRWRWYWE